MRVSGIAAGLHAIIELPGGVEESTVQREADRRGLRLDVLSRFRHPDAPEDGRLVGPAVIAGYGAPSEHAYAGALEALCEVLEEATRARRAGSVRRGSRGSENG